MTKLTTFGPKPSTKRAAPIRTLVVSDDEHWEGFVKSGRGLFPLSYVSP